MLYPLNPYAMSITKDAAYENAIKQAILSNLQNSESRFGVAAPITVARPGYEVPLTPNSMPPQGLKGWFSTVWNNAKEGKPLLNAKGPGLRHVKNTRTKILGAKLWKGGPKVSTVSNVLNAGIQGAQAVKGLYDNSQTDTDISDLKQDIRELKLSNPMYADNLTPDQLKTLRQLDSGTQGADLGDALEGGIKGIPKALFSALMGGLSGNLPGAIIGGVGSLVNSGIEGYGKAQQEQMSELQGLYGALNQGYSDYRSMKRPSNLYTGGLQSRYRNMYN